MSEDHVIENGVRYKSLDFLGFPYHRIGSDGSVWSKTRAGVRIISDETVVRIQELHDFGQMQKHIAKELEVSEQFVSEVIHGDRKQIAWKRLRVSPSKKLGYLVARLSYHGKPKNIFVHRLVLLAFVGPCPEGMECRHFPDGNPVNNRLENLQWGTKEENYKDKVQHGTHYKGERNPRAMLTEGDVKEIRAMHKEKRCTVPAIAQMFRVSVPCVEAIVYGRNWKNVS